MICDRCNNKIPDTQHYDIQIGIPLVDVTLCKKCIDAYKVMMFRFWGFGPPATRERIGSDGHSLDYIDRLIKHIGPPIGNIPEPKIEGEPIHEGRRPTNIFSKIFYKMFFQRVE